MKSYQSFEPSSPDEEEQQHHRRLSTNDLGSMENLSELTSLTELNTRLSPPSETPYFEDCVKHVRHLASSSVRFLFCLSVVATMFLVIQSETTLLDFAAGEDESSHWIGAAANDAWELGFSGWKAHRLAQSSMVHVVDDSSSATAAAAAAAALERLGSSQHGNSKQQQSTTDTTTTTTTIASPPPEGCETTVMLIRHCEKGNLKSHCNYLGFERAAYLASLFGDDPKDRWPLPSKLYAMRAKGRTHGKKSNYREIETVQFIASKAAANNHHYLEINEGYDSSNEKNLASEILESIVGGQQCGKLTLVSWKHSELPKLAQHLGCGPMEGCPYDYKGNQFDEVWQIKYVYRSFRHTTDNHGGVKETGKHWDVFGSVQHEQFDPLAFSKTVGDYPHQGTDQGARWKPSEIALYD